MLTVRGRRATVVLGIRAGTMFNTGLARPLLNGLRWIKGWRADTARTVLTQSTCEFQRVPVAFAPQPYFGVEPEPWLQNRSLWQRRPMVVSNADVYGGLFAVVANGRLIQQDKETELPLYAWNYSEHFTQAGRQYLLDTKRATKVHTLEEAVLVSNRASANYFHWMFEALPKILAHEGSSPLIVSAGMPSQHYEGLSMLALERPVLTIGLHDRVSVQHLTVPASPCYLPDDPQHVGSAVVGSEAVKALATAFLKSAPLPKRDDELLWVSRSGYAKSTGSRDLVNASQIENLLVRHGATVFHPHQANLIEQRERFASARVVVLPAGAAFANVVFCRSGATVIALAQSEHTDLGFFGEIARALGLRFATVYGLGVEEGSSGRFASHRNIHVEPAALERALAWASALCEPDGIVPMR